MNQLRLVETIDGVVQSIVVVVAPALDGRFDAGCREALGVSNAHILRTRTQGIAKILVEGVAGGGITDRRLTDVLSTAPVLVLAFFSCFLKDIRRILRVNVCVNLDQVGAS